jgi:hypothetical protein
MGKGLAIGYRHLTAEYMSWAARGDVPELKGPLNTISRRSPLSQRAAASCCVAAIRCAVQAKGCRLKLGNRASLFGRLWRSSCTAVVRCVRTLSTRMRLCVEDAND